MTTWRDCNMHIIDKVNESISFPKSVEENCKPKEIVTNIMEGEHNMNTAQVSILHAYTTICLVEGAKNQEFLKMSDFVLTIVNCKK